MGTDKPVLIAIDEAWREEVSQYLADNHFDVVQASTYDDALNIVRTQMLLSAIVVSNWLISNEGDASELASLVIGKIPSITLVRKVRIPHLLDLIFDPPKHEYTTIPVDRDALILLLKRIGIT